MGRPRRDLKRLKRVSVPPPGPAPTAHQHSAPRSCGSHQHPHLPPGTPKPVQQSLRLKVIRPRIHGQAAGGVEKGRTGRRMMKKIDWTRHRPSLWGLPGGLGVGRGQCASGWAVDSHRAKAAKRAKGTGVRIWCPPVAIMGPEKQRQAGLGAWSEESPRWRGEKILRRRGRGLCSSESCWEQIRRYSSRKD